MGPSLLVSTLTGVHHLDWTGKLHPLAGLDPASIIDASSTLPSTSPRTSFSGADGPQSTFAFSTALSNTALPSTGCGDDAPILLAAYSDRLVVGYLTGGSPGMAPNMIPHVRACGVGDALLTGWITLAAALPAVFADGGLAALHATLAVSASAADGARLSGGDATLGRLLASVTAAGLAAALQRSPGAATSPGALASACVACGDLTSAVNVLKKWAETACEDPARGGAAAMGTHLGCPTTQGDIAQVLMSVCGAALAKGDWGSAWDVALLSGDVITLLAVVHAAQSQPGGGAATALEPRMQRVTDAVLRHSLAARIAAAASQGNDEVSATAAALIAAGRASTSAGTTQSAWNVRTAPGNGALCGVVNAPGEQPRVLGWLDPRQGGAHIAVAGTAVKPAPGLEFGVQRRVTPIAALPSEDSVSGAQATSSGSSFFNSDATFAPSGSPRISYSHSVRPSTEISRPPSVASSMSGADEAVPTSHLFAHAAGRTHQPPQQQQQPTSRPPSTTPSSADGAGNASSSDDEFGGGGGGVGSPFGGPSAGRRFVVNIRSDVPVAPALPARSLPKLPGAPASTQFAAVPASVRQALAAPASVRPAAGAGWQRPFDPFAALPEDNGEDAGGAAAKNPF